MITVVIYSSYMETICTAKINECHVRLLGPAVWGHENSWGMYWNDFKRYIDSLIGEEV